MSRETMVIAVELRTQAAVVEEGIVAPDDVFERAAYLIDCTMGEREQQNVLGCFFKQTRHQLTQDDACLSRAWRTNKHEIVFGCKHPSYKIVDEWHILFLVVDGFGSLAFDQ